MISKNKAEGLTLPAIETYSKATIILRVLVKNEKKKNGAMEQKRELWHTLAHINEFMTRVIIQLERMVFSKKKKEMVLSPSEQI